MKVSLKAGTLLAWIPMFAAAQPLRWYQARPAPPVSFQNSSRIESLMRAGQNVNAVHIRSILPTFQSADLEPRDTENHREHGERQKTIYEKLQDARRWWF